MRTDAQKEWQKGELYELLCLLGIAECAWVAGVNLDIFPVLNALALQNGLSDFIFLGFTMSFAFAVASVRKSFRLRNALEARAAAELQAQTLARHDALTGLPNRRRLVEAIQRVATHRSPDQAYAVVLIDLDKFKSANDMYGHEAGDAVLCEAAARIEALLPEGGLAARLGGDEFCAFLPYRSRDELIRFAHQLVVQLSAPFRFNASEIEVGATVGISLLPEDGSEPEALLRAADIAMYRGKRDGRGTYRFFEQQMDQELRARATLELELRHAIAKGEIKPHYQPLVALPGRELQGFEILARWYHPTRGVLLPDVFIPIAEDTGLISELSYSVLREACADARAWPPHLRLAINISPCQLKDRSLTQRLLAILTECGFAPGRLEVEITESALVDDLEAARFSLRSLQNVGVSIALDDFGTGYSSLGHLREMKFDKIKIDRSFVQSLGKDEESAKIINAILGLGKSLGVLTTAEGIESSSKSDWLATQGCANGQGFLFGPPMSALAVTELLSPRHSTSAAAERREAAA